jgi:hypothetical protein
MLGADDAKHLRAVTQRIGSDDFSSQFRSLDADAAPNES